MLPPSRALRVLRVLVPLALAAPALAQNGDRDGESQPDLPHDLVVPPAPALTPAEQLATFELPAGYRIELVAAEPLVRDPVVAFFDYDQRLWVCEMTGYMPDIDGTAEDRPIGEIAVLEDTDGDGRMDTRAVFADGLVLPRAIAPHPEGLLAIVPPNFVLMRDTDGDGRADDTETIGTGFGGIHSPEHAPNSLTWGLDNWLWLSNHSLRYRQVDGRWETQPTNGGGQWGLTRDDVGRFYFNTNSDPLRGDQYASSYGVRNPHHGRASGLNERVARDMAVWPSRITPGVNRGYQPETLRDDFTLARFTGACSPMIVRGDALRDEDRGDAILCEPCGHLLKQYDLVDEGGVMRATPTWERRELLTSTDERFRPVNLFEGPDGGTYVLDMYRGVIQHRLFVTSFLRKQVEARELEEPVNLGRIWRIVHEDATPEAGPDLPNASWTEIVACLSHPNAWWRDTAQRLLVTEGALSRDARELVRAAALSAEEPLGRMHALWCLEGMGARDFDVLAAALADPDERVVHAAVRCAEPILRAGGERADRVVALLEALGRRDVGPRLARQIRLTLGEARSAAGDAALRALLTHDASSGAARSAVLSGLRGRELEFTIYLLASEPWRDLSSGRDVALRLLARCVAQAGRSDHIEALVAVMATRATDEQRAALEQGLLDGRPIGPDGNPTYLPVARRPAELDQLEGSRLADWLLWPGRADVDVPVIRELTASEQELFARGAELFAQTCSTCHQQSGLGEPGKAPPLRHSEWVLGDVDRVARIVKDGLAGEITVRNQRWTGDMPAWTADDEDLAAVLTYLRREWGHGADPVSPEDIAAIREQYPDRGQPWTADEL